MSVPLLTSFRISVTRMDDSFEENDGLATIETLLHGPQLAGLVSPRFRSNVGYYDHVLATFEGMDSLNSSYHMQVGSCSEKGRVQLRFLA